MTEHRAGSVDLVALKADLEAIGADCGRVEKHNTGQFMLVGPWCVYSDGEIRTMGDSFGMGNQWPVVDIIRKHVAPAQRTEGAVDLLNAVELAQFHGAIECGQMRMALDRWESVIGAATRLRAALAASAPTEGTK